MNAAKVAHSAKFHDGEDIRARFVSPGTFVSNIKAFARCDDHFDPTVKSGSEVFITASLMFVIAPAPVHCQRQRKMQSIKSISQE